MTENEFYNLVVEYGNVSFEAGVGGRNDDRALAERGRMLLDQIMGAWRAAQRPAFLDQPLNEGDGVYRP